MGFLIGQLIGFALFIGLCVITGKFAKTKNRDPWPWGLSCLIGGIVPIIILACMKPLGAVATVKDPVETIPEYTGTIEIIQPMAKVHKWEPGSNRVEFQQQDDFMPVVIFFFVLIWVPIIILGLVELFGILN